MLNLIHTYRKNIRHQKKIQSHNYHFRNQNCLMKSRLH